MIANRAISCRTGIRHVRCAAFSEGEEPSIAHDPISRRLRASCLGGKTLSPRARVASAPPWVLSHDYGVHVSFYSFPSVSESEREMSDLIDILELAGRVAMRD